MDGDLEENKYTPFSAFVLFNPEAIPDDKTMVRMKGTSLFFAPFAPFNPEAVPEAERLSTVKGTTKLVRRFSSCPLLS